jgi:hypothetical protein
MRPLGVAVPGLFVISNVQLKAPKIDPVCAVPVILYIDRPFLNELRSLLEMIEYYNPFGLLTTPHLEKTSGDH